MTTVEVVALDGSPNTADDLVEVYQQWWRSLVALAMTVVRDRAEAEDVVQDAFVAVHRAPPRLRDEKALLAYLRQAVVNRGRSRLRHLAVAAKHRAGLVDAPAGPADEPMLRRDECERLADAVRRLPDRQREVLALRYWSDTPDDRISLLLGISEVGVRSAASRGLARLRTDLEELS